VSRGVNSRLYIRRGIVRQRVGETKTEYSNRPLVIDGAMLDVLKAWKQGSEFSGLDDWMFASPAHIGRLPWSMDAVDDAYRKAAKAAGIGTVGTHTMQNIFRSAARLRRRMVGKKPGSRAAELKMLCTMPHSA
jgi:integrase